MFMRRVRGGSRVWGLAVLLCVVVLAGSASPALAQGSDHVYQVTFVARWCPAYTDVYANLLRSNIMESLHDLGPDSQYADPGLLVNPVYEDAGVQLACHPLPGWQFTLGRYYETRAVTGAWGSLSRVTGPFLTDIITQRSAPLLDEHGNIVQGRRLAGSVTIELTPQQVASPNRLWVQGGTPSDPVLARMYGTVDSPEYGFGVIRCAADKYNGDNVEYISFPTGVTHVFCYAFYVKPPAASGTITIQKHVVDPPAGENPAFPFHGSISFDPNGFQLTNGGSIDFYRAGNPPSPWTVTESPVDDYPLESVKCQSTIHTSSWTITGPTASINLAAGDHVTCVYTNRYGPPPGGLTIVKISRGGVGRFSYTVTGRGGVHSASATTVAPNVPVVATPASTTLAPGPYQISERTPRTPEGTWRLGGVSCNGVRSSPTRPVDVTVAGGAQVTCVFVNTFIPRGSISLAKITQGSTGKTNFLIASAQGPPVRYQQTATTTEHGVAAEAVPNTPADVTDHLGLGSYRIIERPPPSVPAGGWTLVGITCNGVQMPFSQGATMVKLTAVTPAVHCVFTNTFSRTPPPEPLPERPAQPAPEPPSPLGSRADQPSAPSSDLAVTKRATPSTVTSGGVVTYRITVTNHGPDSASRVVLNDQAGGSSAIVSVMTDRGQCQTGTPIRCRLGTLKPRQTVNITVRLRVTAGSSTFTNRVVVGTATYDPNLSNNAALASVAVAPALPSGLG
jgi:uncharacterized repeat protein (TIGR01451 family)